MWRGWHWQRLSLINYIFNTLRTWVHQQFSLCKQKCVTAHLFMLNTVRGLSCTSNSIFLTYKCIIRVKKKRNYKICCRDVVLDHISLYLVKDWWATIRAIKTHSKEQYVPTKPSGKHFTLQAAESPHTCKQSCGGSWLKVMIVMNQLSLSGFVLMPSASAPTFGSCPMCCWSHGLEVLTESSADLRLLNKTLPHSYLGQRGCPPHQYDLVGRDWCNFKFSCWPF